LIDDGDQLLNIFINEPLNWINAISLAISNLKDKKKVVSRLHNIPLTTKLVSSDIGKYVAIMGTIITTGAPKLLLEKACFQCL
jgi:DNA replicative helicase MCM subunit Mcm2 (Cdc46/Mcm family)